MNDLWTLVITQLPSLGGLAFLAFVLYKDKTKCEADLAELRKEVTALRENQTRLMVALAKEGKEI